MPVALILRLLPYIPKAAKFAGRVLGFGTSKEMMSDLTLDAALDMLSQIDWEGLGEDEIAQLAEELEMKPEEVEELLKMLEEEQSTQDENSSFDQGDLTDEMAPGAFQIENEETGKVSFMVDMLPLTNGDLLDKDGSVYVVSGYDDKGEPIYKRDPDRQMELGESTLLPTGWTTIQVSDGRGGTHDQEVYIMNDGKAFDLDGVAWKVAKGSLGVEENLQLNPENLQVEDLQNEAVGVNGRVQQAQQEGKDPAQQPSTNQPEPHPAER